MPISKVSQRTLQARENRNKAVHRRKQGWSTYKIADELGVTHQAVSKMLTVALRELAEEQRDNTEVLRALENTRLDYLLEKLEDRIEAADLSAINTCLRISEQRAKLNGLNGPQAIEHSGGISISLQLQDCSKKEDVCNITPVTRNSSKRLQGPKG